MGPSVCILGAAGCILRLCGFLCRFCRELDPLTHSRAEAQTQTQPRTPEASTKLVATASNQNRHLVLWRVKQQHQKANMQCVPSSMHLPLSLKLRCSSLLARYRYMYIYIYIYTRGPHSHTLCISQIA